MDMARKANDLVQLIILSVCSDIYCLASCDTWRHIFAIPMGGSLCAKSAELHCIWSNHLSCD